MAPDTDVSVSALAKNCENRISQGWFDPIPTDINVGLIVEG